MSTYEKKLENAIRIAVNKNGRLFRCNAGKSWQGKMAQGDVTKRKYTVTLLNPRIIHGLPAGTPDVCGFIEIEITNEMVGKTMPVFTGIELKTPTGKLRDTQRKALAYLKKVNAITGVARTVEEFWKIVNEWRHRQAQRRGKE